MVINKYYICFIFLILEMYGRRRRKNRSSTIVSGTNNQERKQHRRLRRRRTITSDDIDGDSGIIRNVVPRSIQNTLRDQRAWIREGRRKYEEFKHIKMDPSSSIPEYIDLFKTKREELTSHFIWVLDLEALFIFIFSLPDHWMTLMISIYTCLGPNKDFLAYMYKLKVKWKQKKYLEANIKRHWLLRTCPRPYFYQYSPIDNLAKILADSVINPHHLRNEKDDM